MTDPSEKEAALPRTESQWRERLSPEQFHVLREKGTEPAFSGEYWNCTADGTYHCAGCGSELFRSEAKFDAGCGWPSFFGEMGEGRVERVEDVSLGMRRVEILCARCGGHLGHVFPDGPQPSGERYCVNSRSVNLRPDAGPA